MRSYGCAKELIASAGQCIAARRGLPMLSHPVPRQCHSLDKQLMKSLTLLEFSSNVALRLSPGWQFENSCFHCYFSTNDDTHLPLNAFLFYFYNRISRRHRSRLLGGRRDVTVTNRLSVRQACSLYHRSNTLTQQPTCIDHG
jgi:hypothetical protein